MASKRIAGITIEIGGDTTKLQKALKGVDGQLSTTQRNLKDINKLLKLDPGNTELLVQKQKNLTGAIDATKDRLTQLKAVSKDSLSDEEWDALQREIIDTEQKLKKLEDQYKEFGSVGAQQLAAVGEKVKDVGNKMSSVGDAMTKGVTLPIVGLGTASVAAWKEVDEAMDTVAIKTGATGDQLAEMQEQVKRIAETIPTDFQTAGDAIGEVNTRFGLTGDALEDLSTKFIQFANINQTDVSGSIDLVQSAMAAFGVDASDAGLMLDVLNKAGQDTGVSMDKLAQDMTTNAATLKEMGFSASDSAMFLANLNKNGIDTGTVMSGLKKAFANAAKDGKSMDQVLAELQDTMINSESDTDAYAAALELFGSRSGPAIAEAVRSGRLSFESFGTSLSDFAGNVENTFNETLDPLDQMKMSMNTLKDIGADIVNSAAPMLTEAMAILRDGVTALKEKWDGLTDGQKEMIIKVAGLAAAIGPLLSVGGRIISGVGTILTTGPKIVSMVSNIGGAIAGGGGLIGTIGSLITKLGPLMIPGGLVVAGIVAGVALIIKNWDKIKEVAGKVKDFVVEKWTALKDKVTETWNSIKSKTTETWNNVKSKVTETASAAKTKVTDAWNGLKAKTTETWTAIRRKVQENGGGIKGILTTAVQGYASIWRTGFDALNTITGGRLGNMFNDVRNKMENIKATVSNAVTRLKNLFNFNWSLPKIKLPHFSISGKFSLDPPSIPHFSVQWYRKAYENAVLFNQPTVVPTANGLKGFGDGAGGEIVLGLNKLRQLVGANRGNVTNNITIVQQPGQSQEELARYVVKYINREYSDEEAVWG